MFGGRIFPHRSSTSSFNRINLSERSSTHRSGNAFRHNKPYAADMSSSLTFTPLVPTLPKPPSMEFISQQQQHKQKQQYKQQQYPNQSESSIRQEAEPFTIQQSSAVQEHGKQEQSKEPFDIPSLKPPLPPNPFKEDTSPLSSSSRRGTSMDSDMYSKLARKLRGNPPESSISSVSVLPPPLLVEEEENPLEQIHIKQKMPTPGGRLLSVYAGGHAGKWEYYLQGYSPKGGETRLNHVLTGVNLENPYPRQEHPMLLSPYSYVQAQIQVFHWPVPVDGHSESLIGQDSFHFQGCPVYVDHVADFTLASDQISSHPTITGDDSKSYHFEGKIVNLRVNVCKNSHDKVQVGDSDLIYLEWYVCHPAELECHRGRLFWTAVVDLTFHHF